VKLTVYIATYRDRCVNRDDVSFFYKQFACFIAEFTDLCFGDEAAGA